MPLAMESKTRAYQFVLPKGAPAAPCQRGRCRQFRSASNGQSRPGPPAHGSPPRRPGCPLPPRRDKNSGQACDSSQPGRVHRIAVVALDQVVPSRGRAVAVHRARALHGRRGLPGEVAGLDERKLRRGPDRRGHRPTRRDERTQPESTISRADGGVAPQVAAPRARAPGPASARNERSGRGTSGARGRISVEYGLPRREKC